MASHPNNISGKSVASASKRKATWDKNSHDTFMEICLAEKREGNMPTTHFNRQGWRNIRAKFKELTGKDYDKIQLKNHWDVMRKKWVAWKSLTANETRLEWDPIKQTIVADDDWWEKKIRAQPECAKFRDMGLENPDKYDELFQKTIAMGANACASSSGTLPSHTRPSAEGPTPEEERDDQTPDNQDEDFNTSPPPEKTRKRTNEGQNFLRLSEKKAGSRRYSNPIDRLVDVVESRSNATSILLERENYNIRNALALLEELPGVTPGDPLYMFGANLFLRQPFRELFIELKCPEIRLAWLKEQKENTNKELCIKLKFDVSYLDL